MNIFIIDNHYEMASMLGQVLQMEGHQVQLGASGREALTLLEHTLPDVIISDLRMPDGDGLQLIDALRQQPAWQHIPVIMMSGSAADRHEALAHGAVEHLTKPFKVEALKEVVASCLS